MTAGDIQIFQKEQFGATKGNDPLGFCLAEIALQLALINEHNTRVEQGASIERQCRALLRKSKSRGHVVSKPTTVNVKTRTGKTASFKALKTFTKWQEARRK
jgi:hypothetical protein